MPWYEVCEMRTLDNLRSFTERIELRGNWLLFQIVGTYAAFWIIATFADKPWLANMVSGLAIIAGVFLCLRYVPKSLSIILCKERGAFGAHNAVLGAAEIGIGLLWGGMYRILYYNVFEHPAAWVASGWAIFSLFRMAWSPTVIGEDYKLPDNSLQVFSFIIGAAIGAVLGKVVF